ncbi:MAG: glycosyltransferase family 2 protein [Patescibacteria group bacterium]
MKIVLPIAGRGSRFKAQADRNPEYNKPKPIVDVKGYPMVRWATGSLPFVKHPGQEISGNLIVEPEDIIIIALKEHDNENNIGLILKEIYGEGVKIIFLDEVTRGAAETALQAKDYINNDEPVLISDSDHYFDGRALARVIEENPGIDGLIPVFEVTDGNPKWSFSRLGEDGYVDLVAEKQPISKWANIGGYYFGCGKDFVKIAEDSINNNELTNNEYYIAPMYNKIIQNGGKVKLAFPKYVYGLGTPEDLEYFIANTNYEL